ncbi:MAG: extracellular solute-binding protein [Eubacteriales bacterium]|nr:extracellular solute-binding protein [Eubacteriales bacterium]
MKKKLLSVILTAALAASMTAVGVCATEPDTQAEKNFKVLSIWSDESVDGQILIGMLDKYSEVNPNFTYEYEYVAASDLSTKIATLVSSDDLPDLFAYVAGTPLKNLINADKVVNISEELESLGLSDQITDGAKSIMTSLSGTDDLYDLPFGMNVEGFWYNKALFEEAGAEVPTTWDELLEVCDVFMEKGIQPLATGGADKWPTTRLINAYAYRTMGADATRQAANGEISFTDEGFVAAAQMVADMVEKGYFGEGATTVDNTTAENMLLAGECAMVYDGSWFTSSITADTNPAGEDGIGFMGVPVVDESISPSTEYPMNCGNILCLSKSKYDGATAGFLQYFVENIGDYAMGDYQSVRGYTYTVSDDALSPITKEIVDTITTATGSTAWWEAYLNDETKSAAQDNVQTLINGDMTAEEYMDSIQEAYDLSR